MLLRTAPRRAPWTNEGLLHILPSSNITNAGIWGKVHPKRHGRILQPGYKNNTIPHGPQDLEDPNFVKTGSLVSRVSVYIPSVISISAYCLALTTGNETSS